MGNSTYTLTGLHGQGHANTVAGDGVLSREPPLEAPVEVTGP